MPESLTKSMTAPASLLAMVDEETLLRTEACQAPIRIEISLSEVQNAVD